MGHLDTDLDVAMQVTFVENKGFPQGQNETRGVQFAFGLRKCGQITPNPNTGKDL